LPIEDVHCHPPDTMFISTSPQYTSGNLLPYVPTSFFFLANVMSLISRLGQYCRYPRQKCIKNRSCHSCPGG
jgi:hypothetical protein